MGDDLDENFSLDVQDEPETTEQPSKKRKSEEVVKPNTSSKKKKKNNKQEVKEKEEEKTEEAPQTAQLKTSEEKAAYLWRFYKEVFGDTLSDLEQHKQLTAKHIRDFQCGEERTPDTFVEFLKLMEPNWKKNLCAFDKKGEQGAPIAIICCISNERAISLFGKVQAAFGKQVKIGKLWKKRMNVTQQNEWLKTKFTNVVVGVPNRLLKLAEMGGLKTSRLQYIILDSTFRIKKNLNLLEQYDTKVDLMNFYKNYCEERVAQGDCKFCLF